MVLTRVTVTRRAFTLALAALLGSALPAQGKPKPKPPTGVYSNTYSNTY